MRVHQIVKEESYEIKPSAVLGADGKPSSYSVIDKDDPSKPAKTFNSAGEAEEYRDKENARVRNSANTKTNTDSKPDADAKTDTGSDKDKRSFLEKWKKKFIEYLNKDGKAAGGWRGLLAAFLVQILNGNWDELGNYPAALLQRGCNQNDKRVKENRWYAANQLTELFAGFGTGVIAAKLLALPTAVIVATFGAIPGLPWLAGAIAWVGVAAISYFVAEWFTTTSGKKWLAKQMYNLMREIEGYVCDATGLGESFVPEDTSLVEEQEIKVSKSEIKSVFANLPPKVQDKFKDGLQQMKKSKQKAS